MKNLRYDLPASLVVFLVALPLCLGVALASGAPLMSGVLAGIIGGIIVGIISESQTSVSGPAAGLTAIVLTAISSLGSFPIFLSALVLAGAFQLILGLTRSGFIANYIPTNVIKGLLAAIGIILILKQIPHAFGWDADYEGDYSFFQVDGENTFSELLHVLNHIQPGAVIVSLVSFVILTQWSKTPLSKYSFLPSSLIVVVMGILLNQIFIHFFPSIAIGTKHLVDIPVINEASDLVTFPDFSMIKSSALWITAFTIAAVASLETLLNLEAVENLDHQKRVASPNRELVAQGIGNLFAGIIGGLPVTSVIVRSSVNIQSGAQTKMSTILHGVFLLVSVLLLRSIITQIPLSALAAILIYTGYKLANVKLFKSMYAKGLNQFVPFIVTVVAIVFTDLLIGILIGLAISIFYLLKQNLGNPFTKEVQDLHVGETIRLTLSEQVSFLNKASIKDTLWNVEPNSKVIIDARNSNYIDPDVLDLLSDFKNTVSEDKKIQTNILGIQDHYELREDIDFVTVLDKESIQKLTPMQIAELLEKGNQRFVAGMTGEKDQNHKIEDLAENESPLAMVVSCIDSRVSPDIIFDVSLGDLISVRVSANVISDEVLGSLEMACKNTGIKLILILGHTDCQAVRCAITNTAQGSFRSVTDRVQRSVPPDMIGQTDPSMQEVNDVCLLNVKQSIEDILDRSNILRNLSDKSELMILPAFYNMKTGLVTMG